LAAGEVREADVIRCAFAARRATAASVTSSNIASFGLGAEAALRVRGWSRYLPGPRPLSGRGAPHLAAGRGFDVRLWLDDAAPVEFHATTVALANGRYQGGGILIAPQAAIDDGLIDVTLVERVGLAEVASNLRLLYSGAIYSHPKVHHWRAARVRAETERRPAGTRRRAGGDVAARGGSAAARAALDLARRYGAFAGATTYTYSNTSPPVFLTFVARGRRDVNKPRRREGSPRLAFDQSVTLPVQDHQRLFVLPGGMPAHRVARFSRTKPAAHPRRLRRTVKQGAIATGALQRQRQRVWWRRLRRKRQQAGNRDRESGRKAARARFHRHLF